MTYNAKVTACSEIHTKHMRVSQMNSLNIYIYIYILYRTFKVYIWLSLV